jgi:hypothetical protein
MLQIHDFYSFHSNATLGDIKKNFQPQFSADRPRTPDGKAKNSYALLPKRAALLRYLPAPTVLK